VLNLGVLGYMRSLTVYRNAEGTSGIFPTVEYLVTNVSLDLGTVFVYQTELVERSLGIDGVRPLPHWHLVDRDIMNQGSPCIITVFFNIFDSCLMLLMHSFLQFLLALEHLSDAEARQAFFLGVR
jgi:hypothetical protein